MIITNSDPGKIERLQIYLFKEFKTKDLENFKYFLGLEIS